MNLHDIRTRPAPLELLMTAADRLDRQTMEEWDRIVDGVVRQGTQVQYVYMNDVETAERALRRLDRAYYEFHNMMMHAQMPEGIAFVITDREYRALIAYFQSHESFLRFFGPQVEAAPPVFRGYPLVITRA